MPVEVRLPDCSPLTTIQNKTCLFNSTLASNLAYQAVFESFNALLVGSVYAPSGSSFPVFESGLRDTILSESPELAFLSQPTSSDMLVSLQQSILTSNGTLYEGSFNNHSSVTNKPLSDAMEE
jgi:hypothetical protein